VSGYEWHTLKAFVFQLNALQNLQAVRLQQDGWNFEAWYTLTDPCHYDAFIDLALIQYFR